MDILLQILENRVLITAVTGWAVAQVIKFFVHLIVNKQLVWERLVGDGGMPSCHSCTVCSAATAVFLECGGNSTEFAIIAILAVIVMHDAMGVRLETGKQSAVINDMLDLLKSMGSTVKTPDEKLSEFVGHTPLQVVAGALLGVFYALLVNRYIFS